MRWKIYTYISFILIITMIFCGCNEMESSTVETNQKILFDSYLVDLIDSDIIFHKSGTITKRVEVKYRFKNLLNEKIDLNVYVEFYDEDDNLLSKEGPKQITLLANYAEQSFGGANIITYYGEFVKIVDHVRIVVEKRS